MGTMQQRQIPVMVLNTGAKIPAIGFGSNISDSIEDDGKIKAAVIEAIKAGYRHFDTHGTEAAIGAGLAEAFKLGLVERENVFITVKLYAITDQPAAVLPALTASLSALQLEYVDLCLIHNALRLQRVTTYPPKEESLRQWDMRATWEAAEQCLQQGLTKAIGVSNFSAKNLKDLLNHAKIVPAMNQVELHPAWQQKQLVEFCRSVGIRLSAWCPSRSLSVFKNTAIKQVAEQHQRNPIEIALRWIIENGIIAIPQIYDAQMLSEILHIFEMKLSDDELETIGCMQQTKLLA